MQKLFLIACAGALGTLARYGLSGLVHAAGARDFPWGTLVLNIIGCLLFGFLWSVMESRSGIGTAAKVIVLTGFMGAFTTFSTFSLETLHLMRDRQFLFAAANVGANCVLGLMVAALGMIIGRAIVTLLR